VGETRFFFFVGNNRGKCDAVGNILFYKTTTSILQFRKELSKELIYNNLLQQEEELEAKRVTRALKHLAHELVKFPRKMKFKAAIDYGQYKCIGCKKIVQWSVHPLLKLMFTQDISSHQRYIFTLKSIFFDYLLGEVKTKRRLFGVKIKLPSCRTLGSFYLCVIVPMLMV
jgi:hypothetical protein